MSAIYTTGGFVAPVISSPVQWEDPAAGILPPMQPPGHAFPGQASSESFWDSVPLSNKSSDAMETDDNCDDHGVPLPDPIKKTGKQTTIQDLFRQTTRAIPSPSVLGAVDPSGLYFRMQLPGGEAGSKLAELLADMSVIIPAATYRYSQQAEQIVAASNILPTPVHTSPLALALIRDKGCARYTDAMTSLSRLTVLNFAILEMDTANPEHKKVCKKYKQIIGRMIRGSYYKKLDRISGECEQPVSPENRRVHFDVLARLFALECDNFALDFIWATEWAILDMLRGSLYRFGALRGTIITLSDFTREAKSAAIEIGAAPITLINGERLLDLLFEHEVGVTKKVAHYYVKDESIWEEFALGDQEVEEDS